MGELINKNDTFKNFQKVIMYAKRIHIPITIIVEIIQLYFEDTKGLRAQIIAGIKTYAELGMYISTKEEQYDCKRRNYQNALQRIKQRTQKHKKSLEEKHEKIKEFNNLTLKTDNSETIKTTNCTIPILKDTGSDINITSLNVANMAGIAIRDILPVQIKNVLNYTDTIDKEATLHFEYNNLKFTEDIYVSD